MASHARHPGDPISATTIGGIAVALITTVGGIIVAVVTQIGTVDIAKVDIAKETTTSNGPTPTISTGSNGAAGPMVVEGVTSCLSNH